MTLMASEVVGMVSPVVSVLNMKGGVGKTTISAQVLYEVFKACQVNVLLVDFVPQYNLSQLLLTPKHHEMLSESEKTLWSVINPGKSRSIFDTSENDLMKPEAVATYSHRLKNLAAKDVNFDLIPGDFQLAKINLMTDPNALHVRRGRFLSFVEEARKTYDLVVLDCNPSSSFMTKTAIEAATHLLVPVRADRYSLQGLQMLGEYVNGIPTLVHPPEQIIIINDYSNDPDQLKFENELRGNALYGPRTLAAMVRHSSLLDMRRDRTGFAVDQPLPYRVELQKHLLRVAQELAIKLSLTP